MRTITKLSAFVIVSVLSAACLLACGVLGHSTAIDHDDAPKGDQKYFGPPEVVGNMDANLIPESSGVTVSRCQEGVVWTHNDSGGGPYVYAVDPKGKTIGIWKVTGAEERDWEDIASAKDPDGSCYIYIGDIGDNEEERKSVTVYRFKEPAVGGSGGTNKRKDAAMTENAEKISLAYPDGSHNAETLLVHPLTLDLYVVSKKQSGPATVYRLKAEDWRRSVSSGAIASSEKVAELLVPSIAGGFLTGGEISPDGRRVAICDYLAAFEYSLPDGEDDFRKVWEQVPVVIDTGARKQGESIGYSPDASSLILTSEKKPAPLIRIDRKEVN